MIKGKMTGRQTPANCLTLALGRARAVQVYLTYYDEDIDVDDV